jgi:hypothetical protein
MKDAKAMSLDELKAHMRKDHGVTSLVKIDRFAEYHSTLHMMPFPTTHSHEGQRNR